MVAEFPLQPRVGNAPSWGRSPFWVPRQHGQLVLCPEGPLEDRLANGTIVPGEIICKQTYHPTLERQDESDQGKPIASQKFVQENNMHFKEDFSVYM